MKKGRKVASSDYYRDFNGQWGALHSDANKTILKSSPGKNTSRLHDDRINAAVMHKEQTYIKNNINFV